MPAARIPAKNLVLADPVEVADTPAARNKGLLGRSGLAEGSALWITPCPFGEMIHTFFMKFSIDVLFLDGEKRVVHVLEDMKPWRLSRWVLRARSVLELPAGTLAGRVALGDTLEIL